MQNNNATALLITSMLRAFHREADQLTVHAYLEAIKDCDQTKTRQAIGEILTHSEYYPNPAQLRNAIAEVGRQQQRPSWMDSYSDLELQAMREWDKSHETYHEALERVQQRHGIYEERTDYFVATTDKSKKKKPSTDRGGGAKRLTFDRHF